MEERKVKNRSDPPPSLLIPLLDAAVDEDRDELRTLWVKLFAALLDANREGSFRAAFIRAAKQMDPLDARVLESAVAYNQAVDGHGQNVIADQLTVSRDEVAVSIENRVKLELLGRVSTDATAATPFGREFLGAVK